MRLKNYVVIKSVDTVSETSKKLLPKFKGPYEVKRVLDFDRYVIGDIEGFQQTQIPYNGIVEPDQMKFWVKE